MPVVFKHVFICMGRLAWGAIGAVETEPIARKGAAGCVLQAEIEKAVSQTVKVQLLTGSTTAVFRCELWLPSAS